jgi:hypothetical protein
MGKAAPRFICSDIVSSFASFQGAADYFDGSAKRARSGPSGMNWNLHQTSLTQRKLIKERLGLFGIGDVEYEHDPALIGFDVPLVNLPSEVQQRSLAHFGRHERFPRVRRRLGRLLIARSLVVGTAKAGSGAAADRVD